jgi:hypothetical protein
MNHSFLKTVFSVFQRAVLFFVGQFSSKIFEKNRKTVTCNSDFSFKINIIIYETINWLILQLLRKKCEPQTDRDKYHTNLIRREQ